MKITYKVGSIATMLFFFASIILSSCSSDNNNDKYSGMLGERFNQKMTWDPDSMSFMNANWDQLYLGNGVSVRRASQIKMWDTYQTVTKATYSQSALVSTVAEGSPSGSTSDLGLANEALVAINGNTSNGYVMINGDVLSNETTAANNGLITFLDDGMSTEIGIIPFAEADLTTISQNYTSAISAGPMLVYKGEVQNVSGGTNKDMRSIMGTDKTGNVIFAVIGSGVEGSADGVTLAQAAIIAQLMGMENAVSMSDGNASALYVNTQGVVSNLNEEQSAGDGSVLNIIMAKAYTAPENAVDLGLSVKWSSMNVGASQPEDFGDFFAWGEVTGSKSSYSWPTYNFGLSNNISKYNSTDHLITLDKEDDAATVILGKPWRMPTYAEMKELVTQCTWKWTSLNGVYGRTVTGKNGNSIFIPAAGRKEGFEHPRSNQQGPLWTSTLSSDIQRAHSLWFADGANLTADGTTPRFIGLPIRPVCP